MSDPLTSTPWNAIHALEQLAVRLKQAPPIPDYVTRIAAGTSSYEEVIRVEWEKFKADPTEDHAKAFVNFLKEFTDVYWKDYLADVLGVDSEDLTSEELDLYQQELTEHQYYLVSSLLPDLIKAIREGLANFSNFDYRVIFLYAGALWSFGFLGTVMFDGLEARDLADVFIFLGPDDGATCEGERGCKQHVGQMYTVAEILARQIIPGKLKCRTSCRHILIPIISPL